MALRARPQRIDTDALKRERPLADVIASYGVVLRREGAGTYRGLCPFHQEHSPSFWVDARDPANEHYFCFGACGAHGDVITFVMERENCSFHEACEHLATMGRPALLQPLSRLASRSIGPKWESMRPDSVEANVLDLALQLYEKQLWQSPRAQAYLQRRGVPTEVARTQRLGYANGHTLLETLRGVAIEVPGPSDSVAVGVRLGLVVQRPALEDSPAVRREFFFDRLVVPELRAGRPIWCIARAIEDPPMPTAGDQDPRPQQPSRKRPKYLGLPGEKPIIGLEHVVGRRSAYLVEGPLDWLAAVGWGLPAFAICGTHFPMERFPSLADALAVYGLFDPDRAGCSAAERFGPLFGSRWRPVRLPNSLDLAELAALGDSGRDTFRLLIGRARAAAWQDGRW